MRIGIPENLLGNLPLQSLGVSTKTERVPAIVSCELAIQVRGCLHTYSHKKSISLGFQTLEYVRVSLMPLKDVTCISQAV